MLKAFTKNLKAKNLWTDLVKKQIAQEKKKLLLEESEQLKSSRKGVATAFKDATTKLRLKAVAEASEKLRSERAKAEEKALEKVESLKEDPEAIKKITKLQNKFRQKTATTKLGELKARKDVKNVLHSLIEDLETKATEEPTKEQLKGKEAVKTYLQERGKKHKAATTIQKIARGKQSRDRVAKEISSRDIPNFEEQKPISPRKTTKQKTPSKPIESLGAVSPNKMARMIMAEAEKEGISLTEETLRELEQRKPASKVPKAVAKKEAKTEKEQRAEVIKANKQIANETAKRLLKDDSLKVPHSTSDLKEAFTQLNTFLKGKNPIDKLSSSDIAEYSKYTKFYKEPNKHLTVRTSYKRLYDLTHEIAQQIRENDEKDKIARQKRAQQAKASEGAGGAGVGSRL